MNFTQNALNVWMEGGDGEEWGAPEPDFAAMLLATDIGEDMFGLPPQLLHYAVTEIFRGEDMYDDSDSDSCSSISYSDHGGEGTNDDIDSDSCSSTSNSDHEELPAGAQPRTRAVFDHEPLHESNWHRRYLLQAANARNPKHPRGKEFRGLFSVSFERFEDLVELTTSRGWYDPTRRDSAGRSCSDVRLLVLGALRSDASNWSDNVFNQSNTNISAEIHRVFTLQWRKNMADVTV